jgi:hypothetical protein
MRGGATRMSPRRRMKWKGIKGTLKIGHRAAEEGDESEARK